MKKWAMTDDPTTALAARVQRLEDIEAIKHLNGGQIDLTGQELADIIAFVHDEKEQMIFSEADIPEEIEEMMHHEGEEDHHEAGEEDDHG